MSSCLTFGNPTSSQLIMADDKEEAPPESPDVHFEPLVDLPIVNVDTLEEDEDVLIKLRARLYRYDSTVEPAEWKERGTGDVKILKHKERETCRVLMRREKTLKICGNHYVLPNMVLKPNCGSDKVWVWSTPADFSDEEVKAELLAIRFGNAENAQKFFDKFEEAKKLMEDYQKKKDAGKGDSKPESKKSGDSTADVADKLASMSVKEKKDDDQTTDSSEKEAER